MKNVKKYLEIRAQFAYNNYRAKNNLLNFFASTDFIKFALMYGIRKRKYVPIVEHQ